jgi:hypothetical protein
MGREVNQPQHWLKCQKIVRRSLVLAQPQSRMAAHKLRSHFQPALPCCAENGGQDHFYGKFKGHSFNTSCS